MNAGPADYRLLDFGEGGRLERWGEAVVARPDARAAGPRALDPDAWDCADAVFEGRVGGGRWRPGPGRSTPLPDRWPVTVAGLRFAVGCAPSGHTGLFPEQAEHWEWMSETTPGSAPRSTPGSAAGSTPGSAAGSTPGSAAGSTPGSAAGSTPGSVLNLFVYTGGASVALAAAGWRVTHVDASRPAIGWARENAALNDLSTIRWIQEDARRFVERERRRGRQYDGLVLDPPAYGRGPTRDWQLDRDLPGLLEAAVELLTPNPAFVLVNVYTGDQDAAALERLLAWALDTRPAQAGLGPVEADTLSLTAVDGRRLPTGVYARAQMGL